MKKNSNALIAVFLLLVGITLGAFIVPTAYADNQGTMVVNERIDHPGTLRTLPRPTYYTEDATELKDLIADCDERMEAANDMADGARQLGYDDSCEVIRLAKKEWHIANDQKAHYEKIYQDNKLAVWEVRSNEYPVATEIWLRLKSAGYNDYVCAGIMGNIMTEVGGQTLNIQPYLGSSYYGICQWSSTYYPQARGMDLSAQCDLLLSTIQGQLNTYGYLYRNNFGYSSFTNLTNEKEVALAFAKTYERCSSRSYSVRQSNASVALNYFQTEY